MSCADVTVTNNRREEEALKLTDNHPPLSPTNIYTFLANLFYGRRSKINPLWNACLVGGWDFTKDEPFIGYVDLLGTTYTAPTLATGFGAHIAQPLLREAFEKSAGTDGKGPLPTAEEAEAVIDECMKVLFYRDARSMNKVCAGSNMLLTYSTKSPMSPRTASPSPNRGARRQSGLSRRT